MGHRDVRLISCDHCSTIKHAAPEKTVTPSAVMKLKMYVYSTKKSSLQDVVMVLWYHKDPVMPKQSFCSWLVNLIGQIFAWWWK